MANNGKETKHKNHTNSILNWSQKDTDFIYVDPNYTDLNQHILDDSTNIGSIHYSANIGAIEKILESPVHFLVHASPIYTYRSASEPLSPLHDSSGKSWTPKVYHNPCNNPPNPAKYVPTALESHPILSCSFLSDSSDSSDD